MRNDRKAQPEHVLRFVRTAEEDIAAIRALQDAWNAAVEAGSADGYIAVLDDNIELLPINAPPINGTEGYRAMLEGVFSANTYDIEIVDRNNWYRQEARAERDNMAGALFTGLESQVGREFLEHEIDVWDKMIVALDQGQLRPTHLRGRKPV